MLHPFLLVLELLIQRKLLGKQTHTFINSFVNNLGLLGQTNLIPINYMQALHSYGNVDDT